MKIVFNMISIFNLKNFNNSELEKQALKTENN